jgi:hypothetical protein
MMLGGVAVLLDALDRDPLHDTFGKIYIVHVTGERRLTRRTIRHQRDTIRDVFGDFPRRASMMN